MGAIRKAVYSSCFVHILLAAGRLSCRYGIMFAGLVDPESCGVEPFIDRLAIVSRAKALAT